MNLHHQFSRSIQNEDLKQEDDPGYAVFELGAAVNLVSNFLAKGVDDETYGQLVIEQERLFNLLKQYAGKEAA